mmetsp:Transcript_2490/g.4833  ORF Transcript_2490/g.4833 Transcript_2490/m.4833 type:complete len:212 (+) Transcript_2490:77-712(+)|eukprot:CAMPEP_0119070610 /NCGR_PEP_ID=MMETSP1178-20130426/42841_1 /TAXON_ID=33656 /ORGANISM="unid sp, Strain CCMP2000" /LENGTH=211 /DNA_ID=CAMNT_0007052463 /DNA_START=77 /DNA_END=712 /DNA_ORIENTATION=-
MVRIKKPNKDEMAQDWKSKEPRELAHEIATFMGGKWPERPVRKVPLSLEGAPVSAEELFEVTQLNPTLLSEMTVKTRLLFLEVYLEDIQDVYSEVMETLVANPQENNAVNRVTYNSLRKFKHLSVSLSFKAVSDTCQDAFDHPHTEIDEWPEVAPDDRPGCYCTLDVATFTRLTAASTALVKRIVDAEGELPPEAEPRIIRVAKQFYYEDV